MDKILGCKDHEGTRTIKFIISGDSLVNPLRDEITIRKEKFMFYSCEKFNNRKFNTYNQRQIIMKIMNNLEFKPISPCRYINDDLYYKLISCIQTYCLNYGIFPLRTAG